MHAASTAAHAGEPAAPLIRLRYVLLLALLAAVAAAGAPRARAAFRLHSSAATFADYAVCMVGPLGPTLLRDNPAAFWGLARRRLIASAADAHPFDRCAKGAGELTASVEIERGHRAQAASFVEYGGEAADRAAQGKGGELTLRDIEVHSRVLAELAARAWPFVRGGYTQLVRPSSSAKEAPHPVELPRPSIGRGLPARAALYRAAAPTKDGTLLSMGHGDQLAAYRSRDGGATWAATSLGSAGVGQLAGRCPAGENAFTFGLSDDRSLKTVRSWSPDGAVTAEPVARADETVFAASCDEGALAAAVGPRRGGSVKLKVCPFRQSCVEAALPAFAGGPALRYPLDIARVDGATLVAVARHGIVRVASSRDDGATWTPWVVAYDAQAFPDIPSASPSRLLVVGPRVLLYAGAEHRSESYAVLVSHDQGASFRSL